MDSVSKMDAFITKVVIISSLLARRISLLRPLKNATRKRTWPISFPCHQITTCLNY